MSEEAIRTEVKCMVEPII